MSFVDWLILEAFLQSDFFQNYLSSFLILQIKNCLYKNVKIIFFYFHLYETKFYQKNPLILLFVHIMKKTYLQMSALKFYL